MSQAHFSELLTALTPLHAVEGAAHGLMGCPAVVSRSSAASLQPWAWVPLLLLVTCAPCAAASGLAAAGPPTAALYAGDVCATQPIRGPQSCLVSCDAGAAGPLAGGAACGLKDFSTHHHY